jgi:hypothetical protein
VLDKEFRRLLPRLATSPQSGLLHIGSAAWSGGSCMKGYDLSNKDRNRIPGQKQRTQMLARALRKLGYEVTLTPIELATAQSERMW